LDGGRHAVECRGEQAQFTLFRRGGDPHRGVAFANARGGPRQILDLPPEQRAPAPPGNRQGQDRGDPHAQEIEQQEPVA
jgi:hypothetical protein